MFREKFEWRGATFGWWRLIECLQSDECLLQLTPLSVCVAVDIHKYSQPLNIVSLALALSRFPSLCFSLCLCVFSSVASWFLTSIQQLLRMRTINSGRVSSLEANTKINDERISCERLHRLREMFTVRFRGKAFRKITCFWSKAFVWRNARCLAEKR